LPAIIGDRERGFSDCGQSKNAAVPSGRIAGNPDRRREPLLAIAGNRGAPLGRVRGLPAIADRFGAGTSGWPAIEVAQLRGSIQVGW
jgi:hypothetical protein